MKVLHILDHSLPHFSSYSLRSDYLIRTQKRLGLEPVVVTSPAHGDFTDGCEKIGEIDCYRVRWPALPPSAKIQALPMVKQIACAGVLSKEIRRLAGELKIDLIHSHSPALNGLAAARASEQAGLSWIYELRCFDEDAAVDHGLVRHNSLRYRTSQRLGRSVLEEAACVVAISAALCDGLVELGVAGGKIFEVPQGVDTDLPAA
jgi:glycosyltransferase involved in cell wall biosynthesis